MPGARPRKRVPMKISWEAVAQSRIAPAKIGQDAALRDPEEMFRPYEPMPGVLPTGHTAKMAMDDAGFDSGMWGAAASGMFAGAFDEGQIFPGYPVLAQWAQRPEFRLITETRATEMTRKWIKFSVKGDGEGETGDKHEEIAKIEDEFRRLKVRDIFRETAVRDGFFGRGHIYLDTGHGKDPNELAMDLGDGRNTTSRAKISPSNPLRRLGTIEPMWTYPSAYNANDPLSSDWYKPSHWYVMGRSVHVSRLLTFAGQEVPDILKPAYAFGGLSMSQMAKPYVDNWLKTRQAVQDLLVSFTQFALGTNTAGMFEGGGGNDVFGRADIFNNTRSNRGLYIYDKETEDFKNVSAPLGGLDHLQAQAQEHLASISRIPLVKLTGISPSGLNASSEGELRCFEDLIHSEQESLFREHLTTILHFVQLSLFGKIDPDIDFEFLPINELDEKQKAELRKINADTDAVLIETGQISQQEGRARVANEPDSPHAGLDIDDMPDLEGEEEEGLMPSGHAVEGAKPKIGGAGEREGGVSASRTERPAPASEHWTGKGSKPNGSWLGADAMALDRLLAEAAEPKTLYVSRPLKNTAEFRAWAKAQGFKEVLPAKDLHVTIAYSKTPVDWFAAPESFDSEMVPAGGPRAVEKLGNAIVLRFQSRDLTKRWKQFKDAGASWDHDSYKPHISITYDADGVDLDEVEPYTGQLEFGPEKFDEIREDWKPELAQDAEFKEGDHPRAPDGRFGSKAGEHGGSKAKPVAKEKPAKAKAEKASAGIEKAPKGWKPRGESYGANKIRAEARRNILNRESAGWVVTEYEGNFYVHHDGVTPPKEGEHLHSYRAPAYEIKMGGNTKNYTVYENGSSVKGENLRDRTFRSKESAQKFVDERKKAAKRLFGNGENEKPTSKPKAAKVPATSTSETAAKSAKRAAETKNYRVYDKGTNELLGSYGTAAAAEKHAKQHASEGGTASVEDYGKGIERSIGKMTSTGKPEWTQWGAHATAKALGTHPEWETHAKAANEAAKPKAKKPAAPKAEKALKPMKTSNHVEALKKAAETGKGFSEAMQHLDGLSTAAVQRIAKALWKMPSKSREEAIENIKNYRNQEALYQSSQRALNLTSV